MLTFDLFEGYRTKGLKKLEEDESLFDELFSLSDDPLCEFGTIVNGVIFNYPKTNTYSIVFAWMTSVGSLSQAIAVSDPHPNWLQSLLGDSQSVKLVFASEIVKRQKDKGIRVVNKALDKLTPRPFYIWRSEIADYQKERNRESDRFRGIVAYGAKLKVGNHRQVWCVFWLTSPHTLNIFESEEDCLRIHGHTDENTGELRNKMVYGFPNRNQTLIPTSS
ncbi:hypothetical protein IQ235_12765 [Oscillatoriales cyanobacterium LEGE 11467]|uniref:Uncharacterized protein n=1 Tax=Zarconia navalis LEGE 11467 TaxID=1828826 RepID=A0A928W0J5_9CYAN|nr:hypothetical protein [Zarconia navalis]MBE9041653.1 hypothetical protein [Zarconia navalis LEGE 11467]